MKHLSREVIIQCRIKLLDAKSEILNRLKTQRDEYMQTDFHGDEADISSSVLAEHQFVSNQTRARHQVLEIERALARLEFGTYGICEVTEEPIERERLLTLPWTKYSIEGAEILEQKAKRTARTY